MMKFTLFFFLAFVTMALALDVIPHYSYHGKGNGVSTRYFRKAQGLDYGLGYGGLGYGGLGAGGYGLNGLGLLGLDGVGYGGFGVGLGYGGYGLL